MLLPLHERHHDLGAQFMALNGAEVVAQYGDVAREFAHLSLAAGVLELSFRTRLVLVGADRARFLHSQCTNDINRLKPGEGCYTAFTTNKGRLLGDANVFVLTDEILLDAEPGQATPMTERLKKFIVSEEVEIMDAAPHYGLLTVQGPKAVEVMAGLELEIPLPPASLASVKIEHPVLGELYLSNHPRLRTAGADLFVPVASLSVVLDKLITAAKPVGGGLAGWESFDLARVASGIPRFGVDMDERNLAPEACLEARAISYTKGCYVGQEILNRLRTFAEVNKRLCRLKLPHDSASLPERGAKLLKGGRESGHLTSVVRLPGGKIRALGYVRKDWLAPGESFSLADGTKVESLGPAA
jgi:folate-binding protein YgfZ